MLTHLDKLTALRNENAALRTELASALDDITSRKNLRDMNIDIIVQLRKELVFTQRGLAEAREAIQFILDKENEGYVSFCGMPWWSKLQDVLDATATTPAEPAAESAQANESQQIKEDV